VQPSGEIWDPYIELILLISCFKYNHYDLFMMSWPLTEHFLTTQSDLKNKKYPVRVVFFRFFGGLFKQLFLVCFMGGFFNANPAYMQWWASYFKKKRSYVTSVTCKSNSLLLIRNPIFIVTVLIELLLLIF
jgi:hypothetical protein